ncbi:MAG TPA: hypothetical protein VFH51_15815 [Myxococcota bacterium]|nr:hypothetical protein [Myxococcota bacterium]
MMTSTPVSVPRLLSATLLCAAAACNSIHGGLGIGRPDFTPRPASERLPLSVSRVYAPTTPPAGAVAFVELANDGNTVIDTAAQPLALLSHAGYVPVPGATLAPGGRFVIRADAAPLADLQLHANAGEVAVVDTASQLHAYMSWGLDPNRASYARIAMRAGVTVAPPALNFPMDDTHAVGASGCVTADPNAPGTSVTCGAIGAVRLSRAQPIGGDPNGSWIEISNRTDRRVDLFGLQVCRRDGCNALDFVAEDPNTGVLAKSSAAPATEGAPDPTRARIRLGNAGISEGQELALRSAPLFPNDEVGLAAPGATPTAADGPKLMSYLRLGGSKPEQVGLKAKLSDEDAAAWAEGVRPPVAVGDHVVLPASVTPPPAVQPADWRLSTTAPLTRLDSASTTTDGCSYPQAPNDPSPLRIEMIQAVSTDPSATDPAARLRLVNRSGGVIDLSEYTVAFGPISKALADAPTSLEPATESAGSGVWWVELTGAGSCTAASHNTCVSGASLAGGETTLSRTGTGVVQHVQWGDSSLAASPSLDTAHVWPATSCRITGFTGQTDRAALRAARLLPGARGQSPADYFIGPVH